MKEGHNQDLNCDQYPSRLVPSGSACPTRVTARHNFFGSNVGDHGNMLFFKFGFARVLNFQVHRYKCTPNESEKYSWDWQCLGEAVACEKTTKKVTKNTGG